MSRQPLRIVVFIAVSLFLTWLAVVDHSAADSDREKERIDVQKVASVSNAGVRYEAVLWGRTRGLTQNGGYVAAIREKTGKELWIVKVYDTPPATDGKEQDKADVFITTLTLSPDKKHLHIVNEHGTTYQLEIKSRSVTELTRGAGLQKSTSH